MRSVPGIPIIFFVSIFISCNISADQQSSKDKHDSVFVVKDSIDKQVNFYDSVEVTVPDDLDQPNPFDSTVQKANGLVVYLTFDDGPYHTTPAIAAVLKKNNVKGSFFIVGSQRDRIPLYDLIYNEMVSDSLFRFYNHTYSHAISNGRLPKYYSEPEHVLSDIDRNRQYIPTGSMNIRLPGKNTWWTPHRIQMDRLTKPVVDGLIRSGLNDRIIGWDFSWKQTKGKEMVDSLIYKIIKVSKRRRPFQNHVVVLLHDYQFRNREALSDLSYFIVVLRKRHDCLFAWAEEFPN